MGDAGGGGGYGGQGCIRGEGTSEVAPESVRQAVGGGCQSGWGRLLSVTNAIEAGTWRQGGWAPWREGGLQGGMGGGAPFPIRCRQLWKTCLPVPCQSNPRRALDRLCMTRPVIWGRTSKIPQQRAPQRQRAAGLQTPPARPTGSACDAPRGRPRRGQPPHCGTAVGDQTTAVRVSSNGQSLGDQSFVDAQPPQRPACVAGIACSRDGCVWRQGSSVDATSVVCGYA